MPAKFIAMLSHAPCLDPVVTSVAQLDSAMRRYYIADLAASSHKTYQSAERRYLGFCNSFTLHPLPTSEATLCYFVACLGQQGLSESSIRTYLSGIRQLQISHYFPDPNIAQIPRLRQILRGIKAERGKRGVPSHSRLPITPMVLSFFGSLSAPGLTQ